MSVSAAFSIQGAALAGGGSGILNNIDNTVGTAIQSGSTVTITDAISLDTNDLAQVISTSGTGSLSFSLLAGSVGAATNESVINNNVYGKVDNATVSSTGGNLGIDVDSNAQITADTAVTSVALGLGTIAGAGGDAKAKINSGITAYIDATVDANNISVTAFSNDNALTNTAGVGLSTIGTVGAAVSESEVDTTITAYIAGDIGTSEDYVGNINLAATNTGNAQATVTSIAGGIIGGVDTNSADAVFSPNVQAYIGADANIYSAEDIDILAQAQPKAQTDAFGLSIGGFANVGLSFASATINPNVVASINNNAYIEADTLDIIAKTILPGSGKSTDAEATASGGALTGSFNGSEAVAINNGSVKTNIGDSANLTITDELSFLADANSTQNSYADGYNGGVLAGGFNPALAKSNISTEVNLADSTIIEAGNLLIDIGGTTNNYAQSIAGGGGIISGRASEAKTNNNNTTRLTLGDSVAITADDIDIDVEYNSQFNAKADSVNASVVGGSGAIAENTASSLINVDLGTNTTVTTDNFALDVENKVNKAKLSDQNAEAGSGGLVDGSAVVAETTIEQETYITLGDGSSFTVEDSNRPNTGNLVINANNQLEAYEEAKIVTGGAVPIAGSEAIIKNPINKVEVNIGDVDLTNEAGDIEITTDIKAKLNADARGKVWGIAGGAIGKSLVRVDADNQINILTGANLVAENINIRAGEDPDSATDAFDLQADTYLYNGSLSTGTNPRANADLTVDNNINIASGSTLESVLDINLDAVEASHSVDADGEGKSIGGKLIKTIFGWFNKNVSTTVKKGSTDKEINSGVTVDGNLIAGRNNQFEITINPDGTVAENIGDIGDVTTVNLAFAQEIIDEIDAIDVQIADLESQFGADTPTIATLEEVKIVLQEMLDNLGLDASGTADFLSLPDISTFSGNIAVTGNYLVGSGNLTANGDTRISITNNSDQNLLVNNLSIAEGSNGNILFNEVTITDNSDISDRNLDTSSLANFASIASGENQTPEIIVSNTNLDGPLLLVGEDSVISNPDGLVRLTNTRGSIGVVGDIEAETIDIDAGDNFFLTNRYFFSIEDVEVAFDELFSTLRSISYDALQAYTFIGGNNSPPRIASPTFEPVINATQTDVEITFDSTNQNQRIQNALNGVSSQIDSLYNEIVNSLNDDNESSIIARNNVFISAENLNVNGIIQSGVVEHNLTLNSSLNSIIGNFATAANDTTLFVPTDSYTYGDSVYFLTDNLSWTDAQAQAESYGGNLVTINDAAEQNWLRQTFAPNDLWIGLTDKDSEGSFEWINGESSSYTNWNSGQPDDFGSIEEYVHLMTSGKWNDHTNDQNFQGIIEVPLADYSPVYQYNNNTYLLSDAGTWEAAQAEAEALGGNLVTINSAEEQAWLTDTFANQNLWTGLTDRLNEGTFEWMNGEAVTYTNWNSGEPNDFGSIEEYVHLTTSGKWNDHTNDQNFQGIIEIPGTAELTRNTRLDLSSYIDSEDNNIIAHYDAETNRIEVENVEVKGGFVYLNGNIINTDNGNIKVIDGYGEIDINNQTNYDLELNTLDAGGEDGIEGKVVIVDNLKDETTIITNDGSRTATYSPLANSNYQYKDYGNQYYVYIDYSDITIGKGESLSGWETFSFSDAKVDNGNLYLIPRTGERNPTWDDYQATAERMGGNLVTINNSAEQAWIESNFPNTNLWIGLTDRDSEGNFEWISGEPVTYTNWNSGQPDDFGSIEDYVHLRPDGEWNDYINNGGYQGLIEIPLLENLSVIDDVRPARDANREKIIGSISNAVTGLTANNNLINNEWTVEAFSDIFWRSPDPSVWTDNGTEFVGDYGITMFMDRLDFYFKADYDINIDFIGEDNGEITVNSLEDIYLNNNILNGEGSTSITSTNGTIQALDELEITTGKLTLDAAGDIGSADSVININTNEEILDPATEEGALTATSTTGDIYLKETAGDLVIESISTSGDINLTVENDILTRSTATSPVIKAKGVDIQSIQGSVGESDRSLTIDSNFNNTTSPIGETGQITGLDDITTQSITFDRSYDNPVVFALPPSSNGADVATVRISNVTSTGFDVILEEASNHSAGHIGETVNYIVLEAGEWELADGRLLEVGTVDTDKTVREWETVNFDRSFESQPFLFHQIQTENETDFVKTRISNIFDGNGFQISLEEDEINKSNSHATETIGYMAFGNNVTSNSWNGVDYQLGSTGVDVNSNLYDLNFVGGLFDTAPNFSASLNSYYGADPSGLRYISDSLTSDGVQIFVQEDTSLDTEIAHTNELVHYLAIENDSTLYPSETEIAVKIDSAAGVHITETDGNLYLDTASASAGDVSIEVSNGTILDRNVEEIEDTAAEEAILQAVWEELQLTADDGAQDTIDATIANYEQAQNRLYEIYWATLNLTVTDNVYTTDLYDSTAIYTLSDFDVAQLETYGYDDFHALHNYLLSLGVTTNYDPDYSYSATAEEVATLSEGGVWSQEALENTINAGLLLPVSDTENVVETNNIAGQDVTIIAAGIGRRGNTTILDLAAIASAGGATNEQLLTFVTAERSDVVYSDSNNIEVEDPFNNPDSVAFIKIEDVDDVDLEALTQLDVTSTEDIFIGSENDLTIGQIDAANQEVRLKTGAGIDDSNTNDNTTQIIANDLIIEAGDANIGSDTNLFRVELSGNLTARANNEIHLQDTEGNLDVDRIYAADLVYLKSNSLILDANNSDTEKIRSQNIELDARGVDENSETFEIYLEGGDLIWNTANKNNNLSGASRIENLSSEGTLAVDVAGNAFVYTNQLGDNIQNSFLYYYGFTHLEGNLQNDSNLVISNLPTDVDLIVNGSAIQNQILGSSKNDVLNGNGGNDKLYGREGNDSIQGGLGADTLYGESGRDTFIFNSVAEGLDIISDYNNDEGDRIFISGEGFGIESFNIYDFSYNPARGELAYQGTIFADLTNNPSAVTLEVNLSEIRTEVITLEGTEIEITIDDESLTNNADIDFASADIDTESVAKVLTISNTGSSVLTLSDITITGTNSDDFSFTTEGITELNGEESTNITVTFDPNAFINQNSTATLTINSNDSDESVYTFNLIGLATKPEINIIENSTDVLTNSSSDFGNVNLDTGLVEKTFTIENIGNTVLNLDDITITGTNASDFTLITTDVTELNQNESTTITVQFDPSALNTRNAVLTITNNDFDEAIYTINLTGTGTQPEIDLAEGNNSLAINSSVSFGAIDLETGLATKTLTISNPGNETLTVNDIRIEGTNATNFSLSSYPDTLDAGSTTDITITFDSSTLGNLNALLTIESNDIDEGTYVINLNGTAVTPEIDITQGTTDLAVGATHDFGNIDVENGAIAQTFTITNTGDETLTLGNITIAGTNSAEFTITTNPDNTLAPGANTELTISFDPTTGGTRNAILTINSNDSDEATYTINLTGTVTGTQPEIDITQGTIDLAIGATHDFGNIDVENGAIAQTFTITNTGDETLTLGNITIAGTNSAEFTITTNPDNTLAPGANTELTISFDPTTGGTRNAILTIDNSDLDEATYTINLTGTGAVPEIDVRYFLTGSQSYFGDTVIGGTNPSQRTYTVRNLGDQTLNLDSITITGINANEFAIQNSSLPSELAPGETTSISVEFTPTDIGIRAATLVIENNDLDESTYTINLTGNALLPGDINIIDTNNQDILTGSSIDFGAANFESQMVEKTFTLQNLGDSSTTQYLTISGLTITGTNAADFSLTSSSSNLVAGGSVGLPAGTSLDFTVLFDPSAMGSRNATLSFNTDDPDEGTYTIDLSGTGSNITTAPEIELTQGATAIPTDATQDFGLVSIEKGVVEQTFTISNTGNQILSLGDINITGSQSSDFTIIANPDTAIAAGASTTITVNFDPSNEGISNATLTINNSDSDESIYAINLTGEGITTANIEGSDNNETIDNPDGNRNINAGGGDDTVTGNDSSENLRSGDGADNVDSGAGNDRVYGDAGNDVITGGAGRDFLRGGADNDTMYGGVENDYLIGDAGDDYLDGGLGSDRLRGVTGSDTFVIEDNGSTDIILDFNSNEDRLLLIDINASQLTFEDSGFYGLIKLNKRTIAQVRNVSAAELSSYFSN